MVQAGGFEPPSLESKARVLPVERRLSETMDEPLKVVTHNMCPKCKMHERRWVVTEKGYQCTGCWLLLPSPTRAPRSYDIAAAMLFIEKNRF